MCLPAPRPGGAGLFFILQLMMTKSCRFLALGFLLLLALFDATGQSLPLNASGKCEIAEVVVADGFSRATLFANDLQWFKALPRNDVNVLAVVKDSIEAKVSGDLELLVYSQSGILRKLAGSITYHISVETKEGKYRYIIDNFVYHYYAQNRNYQMVKTGKTKGLEESKAAGWQKLWTQHRKTIFGVVTGQVNELKTKMTETSKSETDKTVKKADW